MSRPDRETLERYSDLSALEKARLHVSHGAWGWEWWTDEAKHFARFTLKDLEQLIVLIEWIPLRLKALHRFAELVAKEKP